MLSFFHNYFVDVHIGIVVLYLDVVTVCVSDCCPTLPLTSPYVVSYPPRAWTSRKRRLYWRKVSEICWYNIISLAGTSSGRNGTAKVYSYVRFGNNLRITYHKIIYLLIQKNKRTFRFNINCNYKINISYFNISLLLGYLVAFEVLIVLQLNHTTMYTVHHLS